MNDAELLRAAKELMETDIDVRNAVEHYISDKNIREVVGRAGAELIDVPEFQNYPDVTDNWKNAKKPAIIRDRTDLIKKSDTIDHLCKWVAHQLWDIEKPIISSPATRAGIIMYWSAAQDLKTDHEFGAFKDIWNSLVNAHPNDVELGIMFWLDRIIAMQGSTREETLGGLASGQKLDKIGNDVLDAVDKIMEMMNER